VVRSINGKTDNVTLAKGANVTITPSGNTLTISSSFDGWKLTGNAGTAAGTHFLGTTDDQPLELRVNNMRILRLEFGTSYLEDTANVIAGYSGNYVGEGVWGATIAGGGSNYVLGDVMCVNRVTESFGSIGGGYNNTAGGSAATVGGGSNNTAGDNIATVGGGGDNTASGVSATVAGGNVNTASGYNATVGGGLHNTASGNFSTVPGGYNNEANGHYSFAAGKRVKANHDGCFIWGDSTDADVTSSHADQFTIRAKGGAWLHGPGLTVSDTGDAVLTLEADVDNTFEDDNPGIEFIQDGGIVTGFLGYEEGTNRLSLQNRYPSGVYIYTNADRTAGVYLSDGGSSWNTVSDRAMKDNIRPVDVKEVLNGLIHVPISQWSYKTQNPSIEHMGPMAQDFYAAFGLGEDDKHISTIDPDGVALAAIQGLYELVKEKDVRIAAQESRISDLETRLAILEAMVSSEGD